MGAKTMKILVPIKRVLDAYIRPRVKADGSGVELTNVKMSVNPFCEIAVEQAIRFREAGVVEEVIVASAGIAAAQETLRTALAMGADRAILVEDDSDLQPLAIAKMLKALVEREGAGLVIMGKQAIDGDNNQTGQMLAALLDWPQATFVSKLEIADGTLKAVREIDGGLESLSMPLPAIATVDLRLNEPRYATLPSIMKAKKKPIDKLSAADLGVDTTPRVTTLKVSEPPPREAGKKVDSVADLIAKLKEEAKVI